MEEEEDFEVQHEFVGREDFLKNLQLQWNKFRIFGVFGIKSVGKTRTVEEFLNRLRSNHPYCDTVEIVTVQLRAARSVQAFVLQIKAAFRDDDMSEDVEDLIQEVLRKLEESPDLNFILNFDNTEDVTESPAVKDLFINLCEVLTEKCPRLKIMMTSTVMVKFPRLMSCYCHQKLPLISHQDGVALLQSVTPSVKFDSVIDHIVDLCLGLPLAILMTGSELEMDSGYLSPDQMVELLTTCRLEAWGRDCTYSEQEQLGQVYSNFIRRLSDVFRQRLTVLGYIPGTFTTGQAQQILGDRTTLSTKDGTVSPLLRRHMVEFDPLKRRYNIHGILKDCLEVYFTIENLTEIRRRYCQIFSNVMRELSIKLNSRECVEAVTELATEHPNLQKLLLDISYSSQETYPIYIHMVHAASNVIENYFEGESFQFYTKCLKLCELYRRPRDDAIVSRAYGRVLTNVKASFKEGETMYNRALDFVQTDLCSYAEMAAQLYQNLGWNLYMQGRIEDAQRNLKEAQYFQNLLGMKYETVALSTLSTLGIVNTAIGNFEDGEKYHMESLKRRLEKHGENHPHIGSQYNNLAILYLQRGDSEKSTYYYRKGLEIKKATNATPSSILISISNVVSVETMAKNYTAAKELLDEGTEILVKLPKIHHLEEVLIMEGYGRLYLAIGNYSEAIKSLETTTLLSKQTLGGGVGHIERMLSLGRAYRKAGNKAKAFQVFLEALTYKNAVKCMPQSRVIWDCLVEMVEMVEESRASGEDNSVDVRKLFCYGRAELLRIISHYTEKKIFDMRDRYDKKLKEWNEKSKQWETSMAES